MGVRAIQVCLLVLILVGLPLAGVLLAGQPVVRYLEFPPVTRYVEQAPFSWIAFAGLFLFVASIVLPFVAMVLGAPRSARVYLMRDGSFPWWGWLAAGLGVLCWILAWTRFDWAAPFQLYTFTPQWLCYIVVINALTFRKTGQCLLTHNCAYFLWLFPLSAGFWWFFEYLNRFVQNWWYTCGAAFSPLQYFVAATLPFATVLPAVLSTEEWLTSKPRATAGLDHFMPLRIRQPKRTAWAALLVSGTGLFFIGRFPDLLFPLLWVAPLMLLMALRTLEGGPSFFPEIEKGDWRRVYRFCLAALICGFFWELWNWNSEAKWIYAVPYVSRFHLFEMPLLGYAGYLPFGLECAVIAELIRHRNGA